MPSFRKAADQAAYAVERNIALRTARHTNRDDGKIHSLGTARTYQQTLTGVAQWLKVNHKNQALHRMTAEQARQYLDERCRRVRQKTLDLDRQALQSLPAVGKIERVHSVLGRSSRETEGRAYTPAQIDIIAQAQTPRQALATRIAYAAGLRAHELLTLRRADDQPASTHRDWSHERFEGRPDSVRYTVVGKGGLIREVVLPARLAERLEACRSERPKTVTDRGIRYRRHYDLGGGKGWSNTFSKVSLNELGWSTGAHGLRHAYAQERLDELQSLGHGYPDALETVSQEMGHFRAEITEVYLR